MAVTADATAPPVPTLPARRSPRTDAALTEQAPLLHELADALGGPFHVLFPERFDANADSFLRIADEEDVALRVYFAKKANKAAAWPRRCAERDLGVDVSSAGELVDALGQGVRGDRLIVTGPAKSPELLRLAVLHDARITVDAPDELERLTDLAAVLRPARILLRARPDAEPSSRFGMTDDELDGALAHCVRRQDALALDGFAVHLSGYDADPRAAEAVRLAAVCATARTLGLAPSVVDIGGGFPVDYLDAQVWSRFTDDPDRFHAGRRFGGFYPYHSPVAGAETLRSVLRAAPDGRVVADVLRDAGLTLLVEPGRALLDQAGFTVFRVQGVKDRDGYAIATVNGTSLSLSEQWFDSEFLPDPVLLPACPVDGVDGAHQVCVGGASCLESDMLTWRRVPAARRPQPGDLLVYPNTAGYQMDSNESSFHELPLPPKIVLDPVGSSPRWRFDRAHTG